MKCSGREAISGEPITVEGSGGEAAVFQYVDTDLSTGNGDWLAAGFIDLQVNGFAGVDFNAPSARHEDIARAIMAIFSTGVTRFFPTVITGEPHAMLAALRNLAAAREMLYIADEVFFTGTAAEVTPIRSIDRIQIGQGRRGPVTEKLQKEFFAIVEGQRPDQRGWLTPVAQPVGAR